MLWKLKTLKWIAAAALVGLLLYADFRVANAEPIYYVRTNYVCDLDNATKIAFELTTNETTTVGCFMGPQTNFLILESLRRWTDYQGDEMVLVRVLDDGYTLAWPGYNTNLPQKQSFRGWGI